MDHIWGSFKGLIGVYVELMQGLFRDYIGILPGDWRIKWVKKWKRQMETGFV